MNNTGPDHYRFEEHIGPEGVTLHCKRFVVIGETPCCYYVIHESMRHYAGQGSDWACQYLKRYRKRVAKESYRRYCYPDMRQALESYKQRKRRQLGHAEILESRARAGLDEATRLLKDGLLHPESFEGGHQCEGGEYIKGLNWSEY